MKVDLPTVVYGGFGLLSLALVASGWSMGFSGSKQYLDLDSVKIATVETGEFSQKVRGYGSLQSQNQRLITATSSAIIDEIKLKPGAKVEADSVILALKNPQLESQLQEAIAELHNKKTSKRKIRLEQQRELLQHESQLAQLKADVEMANLTVEAQSSLIQSGVVSAIEAKRNQLQAKQLNERLILEQKRLKKLQEVHAEHLQILDDAILQANTKFETAKNQLDELVVKAGISGVLQRMPVTLGQSVSIGDELALVGSLDSLIAEIQVPQMQANLVKAGSEAEIDTRHGLVTGYVLRVDPVVQDGAVKVDIQLPKKLSDDIRPMQMVDAIILGKKRNHISSVQKPYGVKQGGHSDIYKLISETEATRIQVQFGQISNKSIEVISGLKPGDKIIISSPEINSDVEHVLLVKK